MKVDKRVTFVENKGKENESNHKLQKNENDTSNKKENTTSKTGSINERQGSDTDPSTYIEDNDSIGWRSLPEIATSSEESDTCE